MYMLACVLHGRTVDRRDAIVKELAEIEDEEATQRYLEGNGYDEEQVHSRMAAIRELQRLKGDADIKRAELDEVCVTMMHCERF